MITETISNQKVLDSECQGVFRLPMHSIGMLDSSSQMSIVPETKMSSVKETIKHMVFHNIMYEEGKIQGYGINPETMEIWPSWSVDFGPEETIIKVFLLQ